MIKIARALFLASVALLIAILGRRMMTSPAGFAFLVMVPAGLIVTFVLNPIIIFITYLFLRKVEKELTAQNLVVYQCALVFLGVYGLIVPIKNHLSWNLSQKKSFYACEFPEGRGHSTSKCFWQIYAPFGTKSVISIQYPLRASGCRVSIDGHLYPDPNHLHEWEADFGTISSVNGKPMCIAGGRCFQDDQLIDCPKETGLPEKPMNIRDELEAANRALYTDEKPITDESLRPAVYEKKYAELTERFRQPQKVLGIEDFSSTTLVLEDRIIVVFAKPSVPYSAVINRKIRDYLNSNVVGKMVNVKLWPIDSAFEFYEPEVKELMVKADVTVDGKSLSEIYSNIENDPASRAMPGSSSRQIRSSPPPKTVARRADSFIYKGGKNRAVKNGMTWGVSSSSEDEVVVSCHGEPKLPNVGSCNPHVGDTACTQTRPLLCFNPQPKPSVKLIDGVVGTSLTSLAAADELCVSKFGKEWQMAEFHLNPKGWTFSAAGNLDSSQRFWVYIDDQGANCWNN